MTVQANLGEILYRGYQREVYDQRKKGNFFIACYFVGNEEYRRSHYLPKDIKTVAAASSLIPKQITVQIEK